VGDTEGKKNGTYSVELNKSRLVPPSEVEPFDLVLITQKYPDHFHPETLLKLNPSRLIVPKSIEKKVRKLLPSAEVRTFSQAPMEFFDGSFKLHFLPTKRKIDPIYDALVLEDGTESILLATHGYSDYPEWKSYLNTLPQITLAITPFNRYKLPVFLGGTVSPGMEAIQRLIHDHAPKYIVATHDEDKHAKGLVTKFAKITLAPSQTELEQDALFKKHILTINDYNIHSL
jgi:L-ascorbate metabolism protein UlaG (beta-lactamase superfamily)